MCSWMPKPKLPVRCQIEGTNEIPKRNRLTKCVRQHAHTNSRTHRREVALVELELLDLQALLKDLLGLLATDNDVRGDLLVTADAE